MSQEITIGEYLNYKYVAEWNGPRNIDRKFYGSNNLRKLKEYIHYDTNHLYVIISIREGYIPAKRQTAIEDILYTPRR